MVDTRCLQCKKEMNGSGCVESVVIENIKDGTHKRYDRIKNNDNLPCDDCGCNHGEYHHVKCDIERCPHCGDQLLSCMCPVICYSTITQFVESVSKLNF